MRKSTRSGRNDLNHARKRCAPGSNQKSRGGAWLRFAGPVHTSGVNTQSRVLAWRLGALSEKPSAAVRVSGSTQRKGIG